jgi:hypothetical protein
MRPRRPGWRRIESGAGAEYAVGQGFGFLSSLTDWISGKSAKEERAARAMAAAQTAEAEARKYEAATAWKIAQLQAVTGGQVPPWAIAAGLGVLVYLVTRKAR